MGQIDDLGVPPAEAGSREPSPTVLAVPASIPDASAFRPTVLDGKPRTLPKQDRAALEPFFQDMLSRLDNASNAELQAIVRACLKVSQINCGWQTYAIADLVFWSARERLAQGMSAGTEKTPQAAEGEARQPGSAQQNASKTPEDNP